MARQWDKTDSRGKCPVCGQHATLDPQHITSQGNTEGANQQWLTKNQGKIVHICRKCHDQMTDSMMRNRLEKKAEDKQASREVQKRVSMLPVRTDWAQPLVLLRHHPR